MNDAVDPIPDELVDRWLTVPEAADALQVPVTRVRQLLREGRLLALRRGERGVLSVPADLVLDGDVVKGLSGVLTLLRDGGYDEFESLRWLYRPDPSLPGTPVQALRENRGTEVKRRAQALGF